MVQQFFAREILRGNKAYLADGLWVCKFSQILFLPGLQHERGKVGHYGDPIASVNQVDERFYAARLVMQCFGACILVFQLA